MDAQRDHLREYLNRWRDMHKAVLDRPRSESRHRPLLLDDDRTILMPCQSPILLACLVEQDGSDRKAVRPERRGRGGSGRTACIKQARQSGQSVKSNTGPVGGQMIQRGLDLLQRILVQRAAEELRAILLKAQAIEIDQAASIVRLARLRSCGSRWRLRRRIFLGVTSTSSSSSI